MMLRIRISCLTRLTSLSYTPMPAKTQSIKKRSPKTSAPKIIRERKLPTHDEIAARAYELFERRGYAHGHHQEDWIQAEAELRERA